MIGLTKTTLGLNLSFASAKLVEIKPTGTGPQIVRFGIEEIPSDANSQMITEILKRLIKKHRFGTRNTIGVLSGESVFIKYLFLPPTPEKELSEMMQWEIERSGLFSAQDTFSGFTVQREFKDEKGNQKIEVLLAAVRKAALNEYISTVHRAGLKLIGLTVKPLVYQAMYNRQADEGTLGSVAMLDFGKINSSLVVLHESKSCLFREITFGSNDLTDEIATSLNISWESAEEMKKEQEVPTESQPERLEKKMDVILPQLSETMTEKAQAVEDDSKSQRASKKPVSKNNIQEVWLAMRAGLERLVSEIERTIGYFHRQFPRETINRLMLTGGGAQSKNLDQFLSERLGMPVTILNPTEKMRLTPVIQDKASEMALQLTLAVGVADKRVLEEINLLPPSAQRMWEKTQTIMLKKGVLRFVLPVLIPLLMVAFYGLYKWCDDVKATLQAERTELDNVKKSLVSKPKKEQQNKTIKAQIATLEKNRRAKIPWYSIFKELQNIIPNEKAWLTSLDFEKQRAPEEIYKLELTGYATSQAEVGNFIAQLSKSTYFKKAELKSAKKVTLTTPVSPSKNPQTQEAIAFKIILCLNPAHFVR